MSTNLLGVLLPWPGLRLLAPRLGEGRVLRLRQQAGTVQKLGGWFAWLRMEYGLEGLTGEERPVLNSAGLLRGRKWGGEAKGIKTTGNLDLPG